MTTAPLDLINQTSLVPNNLLGYSSNQQSVIEITPTSIVLGGNLTTTPVYITVNATTGLSTTNPNGIQIASDIDMNSNDINNIGLIRNTDNEFYALSKDAYPLPNPYSSGVQSVSTWTERTTPVNTWQGICWSPELKLFVAVADTTSGINNVMTSPDGITWTSQTTPAGTNNWKSVVWSKELGLFCAVASSGTGATGKIMTSPDGITWTYQLSDTSNVFRNIVWSAELGLFVMGGFGATGVDNVNRVQTSPNGTTWTKRQSGIVLTNCNGSIGSSVITCDDTSLLKVGMSIFINSGGGAISAGGTFIIDIPTSTSFTINGTITTALSSSTIVISPNFQGFCWSAELGLLVGVGSSGGGYRVMTSPNGIDWTFRYSGITLTNCSGTSGTNIITCNDTSVLRAGMSVFIMGGVGVVPFNSTITAITSPTTFTILGNITTTLINATLNANTNWRNVCWSKELGIFVVVGDDANYGGGVMTSPDGINWTTRYAPSASNSEWQSICWSSQLGLFVATAPATSTTNLIMSSPNGIDWTLRTQAIPFCLLRSICWSAELGIFAIAVQSANAQTSSLVGRPPTSYNVFNSSFNNIDSSGNWTLKAKLLENTGGTIEINGTQINLDATTIDLQNTTTTTSVANHNADIKATSNGLNSTTFLKVKLNGNDIWIPYFTTDPSL